jgi:hypothetical protein
VKGELRMKKPRSLDAKKRASETYRIFHSCEKTGENNLVPQKVANLYGLKLAQVNRAITMATRKHPLWYAKLSCKAH